MPRSDDEAFSLGASAETQAALRAVLARMDALLEGRDDAVSRAMTDYSAHGVSDEYVEREKRWSRASSDLRAMVAGLRSALMSADNTALDALARARTVVDTVGLR